jgi:hypothetical protein
MSDSKRLIRPVVWILVVGATALGLYNVYGDNADVVAQAEQVACGAAKCAVSMTHQERAAWGQKFTFQTSLEEKGKKYETVDVSCSRSMVLVGEYSCARK